MREIILKKRYPHSREEDITDAFMRGYEKGKADRPRGKWHHIQSVCYGGGTMNEVVCSKCHEHYILPTNFCPYCGSDNRER